MKFGQLIESNMENSLLEKSYTKHDGETSPRRFYEKLKLSISLDNLVSITYKLVSYSLIYYMAGWGLSKYIEINCRPLAFISY